MKWMTDFLISRIYPYSSLKLDAHSGVSFNAFFTRIAIAGKI